MQRHVFPVLLMSTIAIVSAQADPLSLTPNRYVQDRTGSVQQAPAYVAPQAAPAPMAAEREPARYASAGTERNLGGGFIEFLFAERAPQPLIPPQAMQPQMMQPQVLAPPNDIDARPVYANASPVIDPMLEQDPPGFHMDARMLRQEVAYAGDETPGTIVIDTPNHFLYLVEAGGRALRYGIGVGRPGFTWSGERKVSGKKEWPDWVPPKEMLERQPFLPHFMSGGPNNPLGARALYLGPTLYRIHGSNEPWTIGHNVSSGCIRMRNVDVIDLYDRVKVGAKVMVL
jgi:lipoprotein-anchoring transpeptidase ErfK/SrfK